MIMTMNQQYEARSRAGPGEQVPHITVQPRAHAVQTAAIDDRIEFPVQPIGLRHIDHLEERSDGRFKTASCELDRRCREVNSRNLVAGLLDPCSASSITATDIEDRTALREKPGLYGCPDQLMK